MKKLELSLPENTLDMLDLLSKETGRDIGVLIHEMALDRYMQSVLSASKLSSPSHGHLEPHAPDARDPQGVFVRQG